MMICVWNVGSSTALKFELIKLPTESLSARGQLKPFERILAKGKVRRIGSRHAHLSFSTDSKPALKHNAGTAEVSGQRIRRVEHIADAVDLLLQKLLDSQTIHALKEIDACAFKTVHLQHANPANGTVELTPTVLERMEAYNDVAPAHNPPYLQLIHACQKRIPDTPMIGAFEFEFHQTIPAEAYLYAVPDEWYEKWGIRRYGFHGASHQYIAERVSELYANPSAQKLINIHLGGSSSLCAIRDGKSIDTSMGFSPQDTIPNATRSGDFDPFAALWLMEHAGIKPGPLRDILCHDAGLAGLSGIDGGNLPRIQREAANGNRRCQNAIEVLTYTIRKTVGAYTTALDGLDVLTFTGGIGEYEGDIRQRVCEGLAFLGIKFDSLRNRTHSEGKISADDSTVGVWVIPTHEEIVVARRALRSLSGIVGDWGTTTL